MSHLEYHEDIHVYYDYGTKNTSFVDYVKRMPKTPLLAFDPRSCLVLFNPNIQGLDPYSENLTDEEKFLILNECINNPWYFLREIAKDDDGNYFTMDHGKFAATYCALNNINFYYRVPSACKRDEYVRALVQASNIVSYGTSSNVIRNSDNMTQFKLPNISPLESIPEIPVIQSMDNSYDVPASMVPTIAIFNDADNDNYLMKAIKSIVPVIRYVNSNSICNIKAPSFCVILGDPSVNKNTYHIKRNVHNTFNLYAKNAADYKGELANSMEFMHIEYDLYDLGISFYDAFNKFIKDNHLEGIDSSSATMVKLELFTSQVLMQRFQDLDVVSKITVSRTFSDLVNQYISKRQFKRDK